jgi:hypothetical protein
VACIIVVSGGLKNSHEKGWWPEKPYSAECLKVTKKKENSGSYTLPKLRAMNQIPIRIRNAEPI